MCFSDLTARCIRAPGGMRPSPAGRCPPANSPRPELPHAPAVQLARSASRLARRALKAPAMAPTPAPCPASPATPPISAPPAAPAAAPLTRRPASLNQPLPCSPAPQNQGSVPSLMGQPAVAPRRSRLARRLLAAEGSAAARIGGVGTVSDLAAISGIQRQDGEASIDRWMLGTADVCYRR